jgi:hypothetical protein
MERTSKDLEKAKDSRRRCEDVHTKEESMSNSTLTPPRIPEPYFTKTDALVTYRVGFRRSIYGWNQNFIELQIAPVPPQNSF